MDVTTLECLGKSEDPPGTPNLHNKNLSFRAKMHMLMQYGHSNVPTTFIGWYYISVVPIGCRLLRCYTCMALSRLTFLPVCGHGEATMLLSYNSLPF